MTDGSTSLEDLQRRLEEAHALIAELRQRIDTLEQRVTARGF